MRPTPRPPQRIRLEELNGASQELEAPWRVARPWKFTHVDGREFEASRTTVSEDPRVRAVAQLLWTPVVVQVYRDAIAARRP